jgi:hypothetical protein
MTGNRRRNGRPRRGVRGVPRAVPSRDPPIVLERVAHIVDVVGTGGFSCHRLQFGASAIATISGFLPLYTQYRYTFLRFFLVPAGSSSSLGTVFCSYDFDFSTSGAPISYEIAVNRDNVLVASPSNSSFGPLTHQRAFGRLSAGSHLMCPRSEQSLLWYDIHHTDGASPILLFNYGSDLLQSGVIGARVFVAFRFVFRGATAPV